MKVEAGEELMLRGARWATFSWAGISWAVAVGAVSPRVAEM